MDICFHWADASDVCERNEEAEKFLRGKIDPLRVCKDPFEVIGFFGEVGNDAGNRVNDGIPASREGDVCESEFLRSEEHTSELQSRRNLVCRLLLEKKNHPLPPSHPPTLQLSSH